MAKSGGVKMQSPELDKLIKKLGGMPKRIKVAADMEFAAHASEMVELAVKDAPVDAGRLRASISEKRNGEMDYEVTANVFYAPYIEWGTRGNVQVPADLKDYALLFRKSADGATGGIHPKPYFFKNFYLLVPKVEKAVIKAVQDELRKN